MFCKNCGMEMSDSASFCNNCGTPVGQAGNVAEEVLSKKEDNVLRMEIKPTFVWGYQILVMINFGHFTNLLHKPYIFIKKSASIWLVSCRNSFADTYNKIVSKKGSVC